MSSTAASPDPSHPPMHYTNPQQIYPPLETQISPTDQPTSFLPAIPAYSGIKVTWWRLLNTVIVLGFGIAKLVTQSSSIISSNIDFGVGVIWAVMYVLHKLQCCSHWGYKLTNLFRAFWLTQMETETPENLEWLFRVDRKAIIWHFVWRAVKAFIRVSFLSGFDVLLNISCMCMLTTFMHPVLEDRKSVV